MNTISTLLLQLRPAQMLMVALLSVVLFFTSGFPALAAKNAPIEGEGTVHLDKIEQKTQEAIDSPPMSLKAVQERSKKGALNEVQGNADQDKMVRSNDTELPVIKQAKGALNKNKKG